MARSGRRLRIRQLTGTNAVPIAGARADSLSISNEAIDITDKDSNGWRTLLADAGSRTISADVDGILKDDDVLSVAAGTGSALLEDHSIEIENFGLLAGKFFLNNFTVTGQMADAVTFTATIQSGNATSALIATVAPAITGTTEEGETLTVSNGTWTGTPSYARQWQRNTGAGFANISGATSATYVLQAGDVGATIRCLVTATASFGSVVGISNTVGPITT
jgi:TP901-1 family phage major tail protein